MPKRILIIGILFCLGGVSAIWEIISGIFNSHISINFAVCLLPVGIGLFKGKSRSRFWAAFWITLGYLICLVMTILILSHPENASVTWFEHVIRGQEAIPYAFAFIALSAVTLFIIHKLLYSEKASAYFARFETKQG